MAFNDVALDTDPAPFCQTYTTGGVVIPIPTKTYVVNFTGTVTHNAKLQLDGATFTSTFLFSGGSTVRSIRLPVPTDGRHHFVTVYDQGVNGTPTAVSSPIEVWSDCGGVVSHFVSAVTQNSATGEQLVDVLVTNTGRVSQAFSNRLMLDNVTVGTEIVLNPGASLTRRITIPADGRTHVLKGQVKIGSGYSNDPALWYVIQANAAPALPPDPSAAATDFKVGETIIVQSASTSTPLATDGSEWVLLERSPRNANTWTPVGTEGGFVRPQEDGTWSSTIETNSTTYPVGSQWDLRSRRFRDYQDSDQILHFFNMISGTPPTVTLATPVITGPVNSSQQGGTWLRIYGTGKPGARLEFRTQRVTSWGSTDYTPKPVTVGSNGKWETLVYAKRRDDRHDYKVLGYSCRASQNGLFSAWSNRLDITWRNPRC